MCVALKWHVWVLGDHCNDFSMTKVVVASQSFVNHFVERKSNTFIVSKSFGSHFGTFRKHHVLRCDGITLGSCHMVFIR